MSKDKEYLKKLRHTAEHVLHQAMKEMYPEIKLAMGPATETGFYFDFDPGSVKISENDFPKIEKVMREIIKKDMPLAKRGISPEEARELFKDNPYKLDWIDRIQKKGEKVTVYWTGEPNKRGSMVDLCSGPHVARTGEIKAFKLLSVAGAYWHGDENNKMLTRIYGTAFESQKKLDKYLINLEEAKKRDHKKLAKELDLIVFSRLVGSGLPMYTPRGTVLRNTVYNYSRELNEKTGYKETELPNMNRAELFKISGHYDKYKNDMFAVKSNYSEEEFFLKPMNCPQHCALFGSRSRSYRELPVRYSTFSMLYRDEKPGEINGLLRTRSFAQDDGHCFCTEEQLEEEFSNVLSVVDEALEVYGFDYWVRLSLRDPEKSEKYLGDDDVWDKAESRLKQIIKAKNIKYKEAIGEAAIYGPKLDFIANDSLGREWQLSTAQLDLIMPKRFGLNYVDADGKKKTPLMIHRAIIGSERFLAILIEHYGGAFPVWLSPVQVKILPITDRNSDYSKSLAKKMKLEHLRVETDDRSETLGAKIRDAQNDKIPYIMIVGDKEKESKTVSIRFRNGEQENNVKLADFMKRAINAVNNRSLEL